MGKNNQKYRGNSPNWGYEKAKQHIEDARILTRELGGTDQDVKKWFFSRSPKQLNTILIAYEKSYGSNKSEYAREAYPKWKSGKTKMSGTVAERLFKLLPNMMPLDDKYSLVESLWQHVGPSKKRLVKCGGNTPIEQVISAVESEVLKLTTEWEIPEGLTNRFKWLSANDSLVYQKLLSHIKNQEKKLGEETLKRHVPELRNKYREMSDITSRLSYVVDVGKQSVELRIEGDGEHLNITDWTSISGSTSKVDSDSGYSWIWWIIGAVILFFLFSS